MNKFMMILLISGLTLSHAQAGDKDTFDDSIGKTQELLKDRAERTKVISETQNAQKADQQVKKLAPDEKTQDEYYSLAAEIMNNYKEEKDEAAMKKSVDGGQRNPADFYNNLTPGQKEKIKALSEKLNPGAQSNP